MINLNDIANAIKQPHSLEEDGLEKMLDYANKYPFSHVFSLLYLKGLSNSSDIRFEEELQKHSYRITDRTRLYQLVFDNTHVSIETKTLPAEEIVTEEIATETSNETSELISLDIEEQAIVEIENSTNEDSTIETISEEKVVDPLEKNILEHVISSNYRLSELNEVEKIALEEKNISKEIEKENLPEIKPVEISIDTKQSFNSWLTSNKNYEEKENNDKSTIEVIARGTDDSKENNSLFGEVKKEKKEFFSPTQKAKESLQEDSLPVSETLAKIYALQGNFPKAITAYMQLSLKYPEKKIFFAIRIKELEKKLNHK